MLGPKAVFLWYKSYNSSTFFQWLWRWETLKKITHLPLIVLLDTEPFSFSNSSLSRLRTKMTQRCAGSTERALAMATARRLHWASADEHDGRVRLHPQPRSSLPPPPPPLSSAQEGLAIKYLRRVHPPAPHPFLSSARLLPGPAHPRRRVRPPHEHGSIFVGMWALPCGARAIPGGMCSLCPIPSDRRFERKRTRRVRR